MSISDISDRSLTDGQRKKRRRLIYHFMGGGALSAIRLSGGHTLAENSAEDTFIGTLSVVGSTGTPSFTLVNSASNKAKKTGNDILAGSSSVDYEAVQSFDIIVSVSGVTPAIANTTFTINVTNVVEDTNPDAFELGGPVSGASINTYYTTNTVTFTGIDGPSSLVLTGTMTSKEYSINGGTWAAYSTPVAVFPGQSAQFRGKITTYSTAATIIATVGTTTDTYTVTTMADPDAIPDLDGATLASASDTGSSNSDGITNNTQPNFLIDDGVGNWIVAGMRAYLSINDVTQNLDGIGYHVITAGDLSPGPLYLGVPGDVNLAEGDVVKIRIGNSTGTSFNNWKTVSPLTIDLTNPTLSSTSPTDNATGVAVSVSPTATFSENVAFGTGNITIKKTSDNSTIEAFDVATEVGAGNGQVSISGATVTINPTSNLAASTEHYIQIDATAIDDIAGNSYAGLSSTTAWSFTTASSGNPFSLLVGSNAVTYQNDNEGTSGSFDSSGGNLIIVYVGQYVFSPVSVSDNKGNGTYTALTVYTDPNTQLRTSIHYCISPTVGTGHTITVDNAENAIYGSFSVEVWSKSGGAPVYDSQQNGNGSLSSPNSTGNVTPSADNALVVTVAASNGSTFTTPSGFTAGNTVLDGTVDIDHSTAYQKQTTGSGTPIAASWAKSGGSVESAVAIAVFR